MSTRALSYFSFLKAATGAVLTVIGAGFLNPAPAGAQNRAETVRVLWPFETSSLDAAGVGVQRSTWGVSWHVYDRLVTYDLRPPSDGIQLYDFNKPSGDLAERWDLSEDKRVYTFYLRNAAFHDGSPVTAEDVRWSLVRSIALPTTRAVINVGGFVDEKQVTVVDDKTIRIELSAPNRYLPLVLSTLYAPIINVKQVKPHLTASDPWGSDWLKTNAAGSGAYRVVNFRPDQVMLERNDKWHGEKPAMRWAVFQTVSEDTTRAAMVERKSADIAIDLTPTTLQGIERRRQAKLLLVPMENQAEFLVMNVQSKPLADKLVRQAVAHAIPQEEIFKSVFFERGKKLFGGGAEPKDASFPQPQGFAYDPERARKLLAEAGYPNGFSTTLSFCTCKGDYFETLALALKDHLARVGIQVGIEKYPGARFGELQVAKQMPLYLENQVAWLSLPDYWIRVFYRGNTRTNFAGYVNPALDPLIQQADEAPDQETYDEVAKKMIAIVNDDIPILYFRQAVREVAIDPEITNYAYWFHTLPDVRSIRRK